MNFFPKLAAIFSLCGVAFAQTNNAILTFDEAKELADQGDAFGEAVVAFHYSIGWQTEKNPELALENAQSSADKGNPLGMFRLGSFFLWGDGVEKNEEAGLALQDQALMGLNEMEGNPYSITALVVVLFQGKVLDKDLATAAKLYKKAADMGFAPAQYNYAKCAEFGHGIPKNMALSKQYLQKAAAQNYPLALSGGTGSVASTAKASSPSGTLNYDSGKNVLRGTVALKVFPGPPSFESIENGDKPMKAYILTLDSPVDVPASKVDDALDVAEENVEEVHLVFGDKYPASPALDGKRVEVTGGIFHSHTGYHCAKILMDVKKLTELGGAKESAAAATSSATIAKENSKPTPTVGGKITGFYNNVGESEESGDMSGIELFVFQSARGAYVIYMIAEGEARAPSLLDAVIENNTVKFEVDDIKYTGTLTSNGLELANGYGKEILKKGSYFKRN